MSAPFLLDASIADPAHRVMITAQNNRHGAVEKSIEVAATLLEDFDYSLNSGFEEGGEGIVAKVLNVGQGLVSLPNLFASQGSGIGQTRAVSLLASMVSWKGAAHWSFSLNLRFVATRHDADVRQEIRKLQKFVMPNFTTVGGYGYVRAPLGFASLSDNQFPTGCVGVTIGNWFKVPQILVVKSLKPRFSKEVIRSGIPMVASASIEFQSATFMDADRLDSFFA